MILLNGLLYLSAAMVACQSAVLPACKLKVETKQQSTHAYNIHGKPLSNKFVFVLLKETDHKCFINLTELVMDMKLPAYRAFRVICLLCKERYHIHLTEYTGYKDQIIFDIEIVLCTVNIQSLNNLLNIGETRVLTVKGEIQTQRTTDGKHKEDGLGRIVSFRYENMYSYEYQTVTDIFGNISVYQNLAEIYLRNIIFDIISDAMVQIFPNLQSLELTNSGLTLPLLVFPWAVDTVLLPRNLSRAPLFQSQYSTVDFVDIPCNIFRRYLNMDGNKIRNLSTYEFHGQLDRISLKCNGLQSIGEMTFRNVSGIQNVDLAHNLLISIPRDLFKGQISLQKIELGGNMITSISSGTFADLILLRYIGLANNSLTGLPDGIFKPLQNIEIIRLEHNRIVKINRHSFSLNAVNLKEIHFQFNPIMDLPHFPFYLRGLLLVNFHGTKISFKDIVHFLEGFDPLQLFNTVVHTASNSDSYDPLRVEEVLRTVDLSNCNITNVQLSNDLSRKASETLVVLLLHYKFNLGGNSINCDCKTNAFVDVINAYIDNGTIPKNNNYFNDWNCLSPTELKGKNMLRVKQDETYCEVIVAHCPQKCLCYQRAKASHLIVDCRKIGLKTFHQTLPYGKLELWYNSNNITNIDNIPFPARIIVLDVSDNKLESISHEVIRRMTSLKDLYLQSNLLTYIPKEIMSLNLKSLTIYPNQITCDCHTKWLKNWIGTNKNVIKDWNKVSCKVDNNDGMIIVDVPDDKFTCVEEFDPLMKVIVPTVTCSVLILLVIIICLVIYAYRIECKVLMYLFLGVHPFDRDSENVGEHLDCVIVHSDLQTDWVMDKLVTLFESERYNFVICDMSRDFVIGYSFFENLTHSVRHSKRMVLCLSNDWPTASERFTIAWRIAQEKIRTTRPHYGIFVSHEFDKTYIQDNYLKRFIKRGRLIDCGDKLFEKKLLYYMPRAVKAMPDSTKSIHHKQPDLHISNCFMNDIYEGSSQNSMEHYNKGTADSLQTPRVIDACLQSHVFISYHKDDFQYVFSELLPLLEQNGYTFCISDKDFVPGSSIEENILNAIDRSHRTMFILTPAHVNDEWSLFTFRVAYEKALREKSNHLLVVIKEEVNTNNLEEDINHYLSNYICLDINDRWFQKKLFNGMPLLKDREYLHTSPLFSSCFTVDENDVSL